MNDDSQPSGDDEKEQRSFIQVDDVGTLTIKDASATSNSEKVESNWKCSSCNLSNPSYVDQCITCLAWKPGRQDKTADNDKPAAVAKSTGSDAAASAVAMEVDEVGGNRNLWPCRFCTLLNSSYLTRCEVCGAPQKSNIPTSVPGLSNVALPSVNRDSDSLSQLRKRLQNSDSAVRKIVKTSNPTVSDNSVWTCSFCSYNNNPAVVDSCDMCNVSKNQQKVVSPGHVVTPIQDATSQATTQAASGSWVCDKCTFYNSQTVRDCGACGTLRNQSEKQPQPTTSKEEHPVNGNSQKSAETKSKENPNSWSCGKCTFLNPTSAHVCAICQAKRVTTLPTVSELPTDKTSDSRWRCVACTFTNSLDSPVCRMCQTMKGTATLNRKVVTVERTNGVAIAREPRAPGLSRQYSSLCVQDVQQKEETDARELWMQIVNFCKTNKEKFVDDSFPPVPKSLYYSGNASAKDATKVVSWMRVCDVRSSFKDSFSNWTVFRLPKPSDICQGILGNCWFLSSLAVLAESPELLERVLVTRDYSPEGVYQVRLCRDGEWITVIIDDLFPCNEYGQLVYSQAKRKQLWVPLIEKALAKIHGSYEALTAGRCVEGLATLTGAPCETVQLSPDIVEEDLNLLWVQLLSSREHKFLMGASCGVGTGRQQAVDRKDYEALGLISRHAYSILDVKSVEGNRLLKLRNPWGRFSWKGDWSDTSNLWKSIPKEKLNGIDPHSGAADGMFWMSIYDFIKYFDSVDICKYRPNWMESRVSGQLYPCAQKPWTVSEIVVFETTEVELGLFQEGSRLQKHSKKNSVDLCIVVFRTSNIANRQVGSIVCHSKRLVQSFVDCRCILEPGCYTVVCLAFNHWSHFSSSPAPRYTLTVHSSKDLMLEEQTRSDTILADTILQLAVKSGTRHEGRPGMTTYYLTRNWAGFIMVVENRNPDAVLQVQCDCTGSDNVVSTRDTLKTVDAIPPLHRQVIVLLSQLERTTGYSITHKLIHRVATVGSGLGDWAPGANHVPALTSRVYGLHAPRPL